MANITKNAINHNFVVGLVLFLLTLTIFNPSPRKYSY
jgi:hypothetical protein